MDLTMKFDTPTLAEALQPAYDGEVRVLTLTGMTYDCICIEGRDCVRIISKHKPEDKRLFRDDPSDITTTCFGSSPNPFNAETSISFRLAERAPVSLVIYNILGERVKTLVAEELDVGYHTVYWNGKDKTGGLVASGIYFYRFESKMLTKTMKMVLVR